MIGILDSGIGGLSVYAEIVRLMPEEAIYYYADSANCPYGNRSDEEIISLSRVCVRALVDSGCEVIVIACNTITSVAGKILRSEFSDIDIVGMEPAIKPAAAESKSGVVGVLATRATLAAQKYHTTRDRYASDVKVVEIVGEGLVEMVENDMIGTEQCEDLVRVYIERLEREGADSVVLGCTHYPFLRGVMERILDEDVEQGTRDGEKGIRDGEQNNFHHEHQVCHPELVLGSQKRERMKIIDPAGAVARRVEQVIGQRKGYVRGEWREVFYSSKAGEQGRLREIANRLRGSAVRGSSI